ncbi:hypothetical protein ABC382_00275 [Lysinibacillus sp. 1P01SD]|uniref:hypothetical protein n=1 Tax=Lysinibacillus sp. 1P01SD TaxID=3132285 RepID=UPI0039A0D588
MEEKFIVTTEQVDKLISLTHSTLDILNCELLIVDNMHLFKETDFYKSLNDKSKVTLENFMYYTTSLFIASHNLIVILLNNLKGETIRENAIYFSSTLFHELRHAWQFKKELFDFKEAMQPNDENYLKQPHEMDALAYEVFATNKFKNEICDLFEIDQNWVVTYPWS